MKNNSSNFHDSVVIEATSYNKLFSKYEHLISPSDFSSAKELTSSKAPAISLIPASLQSVASRKSNIYPSTPVINVSSTRNKNSLPQKLSLVSNGIVKKLVRNRQEVAASSLIRDPRVSKIIKVQRDVKGNGASTIIGLVNQNQIKVTSISDVENSDPHKLNVLKKTMVSKSSANQTTDNPGGEVKNPIPPIVLPELSVSSSMKKSPSADEFPDLLKPQNLTRYVQLSTKSQDNNSSSKRPTIQYKPYYSHLRDHDYTLNCARIIPKEKTISITSSSSSSSTTKRSFIIPKKKKKLNNDPYLSNSVSNNNSDISSTNNSNNSQGYSSNDTQVTLLKVDSEHSSSSNVQTAISTSPLPSVSSENTTPLHNETPQATTTEVSTKDKASCSLSALQDYVCSQNPFDCRNVDNHDIRSCDVCKDFFPKPSKSGERCTDDVFPDVIPCQMCSHLSEDHLTANYVKHCNVNSALGQFAPCSMLSCPVDEAMNSYGFDFSKDLASITPKDVEGILDSDYKSLKTIDQNDIHFRSPLDTLIAPTLPAKSYDNFCNFALKDLPEPDDNIETSILDEYDFLFISKPEDKLGDSSSPTENSDPKVNEDSSEKTPMEVSPVANVEEKLVVKNSEEMPLASLELNNVVTSEESPISHSEESPVADSEETAMDTTENKEELLLNKVPTYLCALSMEAINTKAKVNTDNNNNNSSIINTSEFTKNSSSTHGTELCKIPAYHQTFNTSSWSERRATALRQQQQQQFDSDCETSKSCLSSYSSPSPSSDSPTEEFQSWSQSSSRSTSPASDSRSCQFSPRSDGTSSRDRSPSPYSQHSTRYSLNKTSSKSNRNYSRIHSPYRYSSHHRSRRWNSSLNKYHDQDSCQDERRIVYVGKLPLNYTSNQLKELFSKWGPVEKVSLHFREQQDNYGFVTFYHQSDAYLSMDATSKIENFPFDVCFGGRRTFCKESYADLDGLVEDEEEFGTVIKPSNVSFEQLLKDWKRERH
ncbi:uncharacterized protein LOC115228566 [Argonauta hians]